ncbi:hypothetical protein MUY27_17060, partial [Mucilaginibacter sp. RS28]
MAIGKRGNLLASVNHPLARDAYRIGVILSALATVREVLEITLRQAQGDKLFKYYPPCHAELVEASHPLARVCNASIRRWDDSIVAN